MIASQTQALSAAMPVEEATGVEEQHRRLIENLTLVKMWDQLQVPEEAHSHKALDLVEVEHPMQWVLLPARLIDAQKSIVKLLRKTNGLQFKSSTLFFIMKNKSSKSQESRKDADWSSKNWTDNAKKRMLVLLLKSRKEDCTNNCRMSMSNFLDNANRKRQQQSARRSSRKRRVVTDNSRKKKLGNARRKRKPLHRRLN